MKSAIATLSVLLLATGCGKLERVPEETTAPPVDAGEQPAADAGALWTMEVHADTMWAATASAGDAVEHVPANAPSDDRLTAPASFVANATSGGATAHASFAITLEERAIRFEGLASQVSPSADLPSGASASITGLRVCLQALNAKKFRRTFECSGTATAEAGGGAAISAVSDTTVHCSTGKFPDSEEAWSYPNLVTEIAAAREGPTCFGDTTITFGAGGGTEGAGSGSAEGSITVRFEPIFDL